MSSPKSQTAPTFAEHEEAIRAALVEVAENSFFAFTAVSDAEQFADLVRNPPSFDPDQPPPGGWMVTSVRFSGAFAGHIEAAMPRALSLQLLCAFLGLSADDPVTDAQVLDSTGEFANQVCGTWLTRACSDRRFDLKPPEVIRQPASWVPLDSLPPDPQHGEILLCLNDLPLRLRIRFD